MKLTKEDLDIVAEERPTPADQAMFLLLASRLYMKELLHFVKTIRAYYPVRPLKKFIDRIELTNRESYQALNDFQRCIDGLISMTHEQKEQTKAIYQLYYDCALLPYQTPPDRLNALAAMVDNFKSGHFVEVDANIVDALQSIPDEPSAHLSVLIGQYAPELTADRRAALCKAIEALFQTRKQLGIEL